MSVWCQTPTHSGQRREAAGASPLLPVAAAAAAFQRRNFDAGFWQSISAARRRYRCTPAASDSGSSLGWGRCRKCPRRPQSSPGSTESRPGRTASFPPPLLRAVSSALSWLVAGEATQEGKGLEPPSNSRGETSKISAPKQEMKFNQNLLYVHLHS